MQFLGIWSIINLTSRAYKEFMFYKIKLHIYIFWILTYYLVVSEYWLSFWGEQLTLLLIFNENEQKKFLFYYHSFFKTSALHFFNKLRILYSPNLWAVSILHSISRYNSCYLLGKLPKYLQSTLKFVCEERYVVQL